MKFLTHFGEWEDTCRGPRKTNYRAGRGSRASCWTVSAFYKVCATNFAFFMGLKGLTHFGE